MTPKVKAMLWRSSRRWSKRDGNPVATLRSTIAGLPAVPRLTTRHGRPSSVERAKRRFQEGRRVAPDDRHRRPERHDDRYQQRGPRQHSPSPRKPDSAQEGGSACYARWGFAVGSHDRRPHRMKSEYAQPPSITKALAKIVGRASRDGADPQTRQKPVGSAVIVACRDSNCPLGPRFLMSVIVDHIAARG